MQAIIHQFSAYFQQLGARIPWMPTSMLSFFLVVAGFLALALIFLFLRLLWSLLVAILSIGRGGRRRSPEWQRQRRLRELRRRHTVIRNF